MYLFQENLPPCKNVNEKSYYTRWKMPTVFKIALGTFNIVSVVKKYPMSILYKTWAAMHCICICIYHSGFNFSAIWLSWKEITMTHSFPNRIPKLNHIIGQKSVLCIGSASISILNTEKLYHLCNSACMLSDFPSCNMLLWNECLFETWCSK